MVPSPCFCTILTRHCGTLHGAIYSGEKLFRYGLIESPNCSQCWEPDTTEHRIITCDYLERIWNATIEITSRLTPELSAEPDRIKYVTASMNNGSNVAVMVHAEILTKILQLKREPEYLVQPKILLNNEIKKLIRLER